MRDDTVEQKAVKCSELILLPNQELNEVLNSGDRIGILFIFRKNLSEQFLVLNENQMTLSHRCVDL